jgi:cyanate permease
MQPGSDTLAPRGKLTWLLFGVGACFSYLLTGIGSILAPLQDELGVSRSEVALLPTLFAAALVAVGLVGGRIVVWVGRQRSLRGAMIGVAIGAALVAGPGWPLTLLGATVLGASCALLVLLMPVLINALHPRRTTAIIAEQNAVNSSASLLAPLLVGAALAIGLGWRPGYLVPAVLLLLLVPFVRDIPAPRARLEGHRAPDRSHVDRAFWSRWLDILLAVSAEFCMVFWIASAFTTWYGLEADAAVVWGSTFVAGMVIGRSLGTPVTRAIADRTKIVSLSCGVALVGFTLFWTGGGVVASAAGAVITGLGIALLYPVTIAALMRARPTDPDGASARGTLASGVAIGGAPFLLAAVSDQVGLHTAFLIVPVILVGLLARSLWRQRQDRPRDTAPGPASPARPVA